MGSCSSVMKRREPIYNRVSRGNISLDPGRSFEEMFATIRTYGIDPNDPSPEDKKNMRKLEKILSSKDEAEVRADQARWAALAKAMVGDVPSQQRRKKKKRPQSEEERRQTAERRRARAARNEERWERRRLRQSRELVPLH